MTIGAHFHIDQAGNPVPVGTTDIARNDMRLSALHFVGDPVGNSNPVWTVTAWPRSSSRPVPSGAATFDATFAPDLPGKYRVQYVVNDGTGGNVRTFTIGVTSDANGVIYDFGRLEPAFGERVGDDNSAGNDRGWAPGVEDTYADHVPIVATVAALRNVRAAKHKHVFLAGYYASGDAPGRLIRWDNASTTPDNGGTTFQPGFGTGGAVATGRWVHDHDSQVHAHWFGARKNASDFNNSPRFLALMAYCSFKYEIQLDGADYYYWDPVNPVAGQAFWTNGLVIIGGTTIRGIPGKTRLRCRAPGGFRPDGTPLPGGGDPADYTQLPQISAVGPSSAILRSHAYSTGQFVYSHGHSYWASVGGTTSASAGAEPTGIFAGHVTDGTVQWTYGDALYRGGSLAVIKDSATDVYIFGVEFDGGTDWFIPSVIPTVWGGNGVLRTSMLSFYGFENEYHFGYPSVQSGYGLDPFHKGIWLCGFLGGSFGSPANARIKFERCTIGHCLGETFYGGGQIDTTDITVDLVDCIFTESASLSTSAGIRVRHSHFLHMGGIMDRAHVKGAFIFEDNFAIDCGGGIQGEIALLDSAAAGAVVVRRNYFENVYSAPFAWNNSFSAQPTFAGTRDVDYSDNDHLDCGWTGAVISIAGTPTIANLPNHAKNVVIDGNKIRVGSMTMPARSDSLHQAFISYGISLTGIFHDLRITRNIYVYEDAAIRAGNFISSARNLAIQNSTGVLIEKNVFRGHNIPGYSTFEGIWRDNQDLRDAATSSVGPSNTWKFGENLGNGATITPLSDTWIVASNLFPGITSPATFASGIWDIGQRITIIGQKPSSAGDGDFAFIPASGANHKFTAPRLINAQTQLIIELVEDNPGTRTWVERSYINTLTGKEPEADELEPVAFRTLNSEAPQIQTWGVHTTQLTPSVATDFNNIINAPDESVVQVYFNNHTQFRHNSGVGAVKLQLVGGADFLPAFDGEIHFFVDADAGIAIETLRVVNGVVITGTVPNARQIIAGAGLTGGGDLSADRTIDVAANVDGSIVVAANDIRVGVINDTQHGGRGGGTLHALVTTSVPGFMSAADKTKLDGVAGGAGVPSSRTLTGDTPITVAGDHAAHDLGTDRHIGLDGAAAITTTNTITGGILASSGAITAAGTISAGVAVTAGAFYNPAVANAGLFPGAGATSTLFGDLGFKVQTTAKNPLVDFQNSVSQFRFNELDLVPDGANSEFFIHGFTQIGTTAIDVVIRASDAGGGNNNGGRFVGEGGNLSGTGLRGGALLGIYPGAASNVHLPMVEVVEVAAGRLVVFISKQTAGTSTHLPSGDGITAFGEADVGTTDASPPVGCATIECISGQLTTRGTNHVKADLAPKGAAATGQGRFAARKAYCGQVSTSGSGVGGLLQIDLGAADLGTGIYELEIHVNVINKTAAPPNNVAGIFCTACVANRAGTAALVAFPFIANTDLTQGAGLNGAKVQLSFTTSQVAIDVNPTAGNAGNDLDWAGEVIVRRMAFT